MNEYYYQKLERKEQAHYKRILDAVVKGEPNVKLSLYAGSEPITKIATALNYDHPELFYVDFRCLSFIGTPLGIIYQIKYIYSARVKLVVSGQFEKKISGILDMAAQSNLKSDYDKCRWVHNYLVRNTSYNYDALKSPDDYPDSFNTKGALLDGLAVCEGISKAFKLLCDRLRVDTMVAFGTSSQENLGLNIPHAWNLVKFNDDYVHVDATWDMGLSKASQFTRYDYFCRSDRWMMRDHEYESFPRCTTDKYSYFFKRNRCFTNGKELKAYLDTELKKGTSVLYFIVDVEEDDFLSIQNKAYLQTNRSVSNYLRSAYSLQMLPNTKQMCFFIRIIK